ncbi:mono/diheme cytochrome c family protein [Mucilaginibacter yixingensis]|uniref:Mono/diheme cytochrome c family protein n=1 Tax=Mucilaginibacter yixingensis TaxID=1295612 RepID=A0A2T5JGL9_9SPHI|nr:cytochrome c [Mucilaginibacter yixingensis]PTR01568.1 mono/diheme cytochrome c family protein [Mucilaginibacter yixingensis]
MKRIFVLLLLMAPLFVMAQKKTKTAPSPAASIARGQQVYTQYCLSCHQADGGGVPNMNPPLIKTTYVLGDSRKLIKVVLNGFMQNVDIDGESYSNNMPPHNFLTDQQIADVLTYVRRNFGNKAAPVTVAQVKTARAANKK